MQVAVAENLFTWPSDDPRLIATREISTGRISFPAKQAYGNSEDFEQILLSKKGTLWTWTVQRFLPKSPPYAGTETLETFKPYAVGYVELPGEIKVETRITGCELSDLKIGMEMELVIEKFKEDEDGNEVMTFAFKPAA